MGSGRLQQDQASPRPRQKGGTVVLRLDRLESVATAVARDDEALRCVVFRYGPAWSVYMSAGPHTGEMARLGRFERPAYGLEGRCSIHLSYRRASDQELGGLITYDCASDVIPRRQAPCRHNQDSIDVDAGQGGWNGGAEGTGVGTPPQPSPHMRGGGYRMRRARSVRRVLPAHAGGVIPARVAHVAAQSWPHVRGGGAERAGQTGRTVGQVGQGGDAAAFACVGGAEAGVGLVKGVWAAFWGCGVLLHVWRRVRGRAFRCGSDMRRVARLRQCGCSAVPSHGLP